MRNKVSSLAALLLLLSTVALFADRRPHEGKITRIDASQRVMTVQGEKGDEWTLQWNESTKLKNGLTVQELKPGDSVHFDYVEKDGQMWLTELRRTHKADKD
jgi:Cu/Ag efflux protein CusF